MKTMMKNLSFLLPVLPALLAAPAAATPPPDSPFGGAPAARYGQVRTRTEYDMKAMADTSANKALLSTQLRTRLGFTSSNAPVGFKIEFQDSRFFGQEPAAANNPASASVGNMKGVDLLQGYVTVEHGGTKLALGRQKMSLGAGRFLSTLEWHPYSRAFDGFAFNTELEPGNLTGLAYLVSDPSAAAVDDHDLLLGLFYNHKFTLNLAADVYAFYDKNKQPVAVPGIGAATNSDLVYVGERVTGKAGPVTFEEEFIWQAGELNAGRELTSQAFMLALRLGTAFGKNKINLGLDMMSGDDDPADDVMSTYRANYYFGHAYFGWMDYFLGNPAHGVTDIRVDMDLGFMPNAAGAPTVSLKPQYHYFLPQNAPSASDDPYGQEIDLELHLTGIYPKANLVLGAGMFIPGDGAFKLPAAKLAAGQDSKPGLFLYFMPIFNF
jgi:hypothetical protein